MTKPAKINRAEMVHVLQTIIADSTNNPAEEMITLGTTLREIGEHLKTQPVPDQKRILNAVAIMHGFTIHV